MFVSIHLQSGHASSPDRRHWMWSNFSWKSRRGRSLFTSEGRHLSKTWCPLTPPHTRTELPKRTALWPCLWKPGSRGVSFCWLPWLWQVRHFAYMVRSYHLVMMHHKSQRHNSKLIYSFSLEHFLIKSLMHHRTPKPVQRLEAAVPKKTHLYCGELNISLTHMVVVAPPYNHQHVVAVHRRCQQ